MVFLILLAGLANLDLSGCEPVFLNVCIVLEDPPEESQDQMFFSYRRTAAALDIAVDHVNSYVLPSNLQVLPHYKNAGPDCDSTQGTISGGLALTADGVLCNVYVGPGCGDNADALFSFAYFYHVPIIAVPAASLETTGPPRSAYTTLIRLSYTFDDVCTALIRTMEHYNFSYTTVLTDDTQSFFHELSQALVSSYVKYSPLLNLRSRFFSLSSGNDLLNPPAIANLLKTAAGASRVIVLLANATVTRQIMLLARAQGMTSGDYVYYGVELFPSNYWGSYNWKTGALNDLDVKAAYDSLSLVQLIQKQSQAYDLYAKEVRIRSQERFNFTFGMFEPIDTVITSYYEAVILYGLTVKELRRQGLNYLDGLLVTANMKNVTWSSPINGPVHMDIFGDRDNEYLVLDLDDDVGIFRPSLKYSYDTGLTTIAPIIWPNRSTAPPDVPYCGFRGEAEQCQARASTWNAGLTAICVVIPLLLLLSVSGSAFYWIHKRAQLATFDPYWFKIPMEELQLTNPAASFHSKASEVGKSVAVATIHSSSNRSKSNRSFFGSYFDNRAFYQGNQYAIRDVAKIISVTASDMVDDMKLVKQATQENIHKIVGLAVTPNSNLIQYVVADLCSHGSVQDVVTSDTVKLDWSFKNSMISDIVTGMDFLHASFIECHGDLTALTCVVDRRFEVKISGGGLWRLRNPQDLMPPSAKDKEGTERDYEPLLYRAPEHLRGKMNPKGTQKGDVYSFAVILQQIILRAEAYEIPGEKYSLSLTKHEIVLEVQKGTDPPFRPRVPRVACTNEVYNLMESCWSEYPTERPSFAKIKQNLRSIIGKLGDNIVDHLLKRMEEYAEELQQQVAEKTDQFMEEKRRSEELLCQLLPKSVAQALTKGQSVNPESYESASIYFSDIVEFTKIASSGTPMEVVLLLNSLYTLFDNVLEKFDVYKVETIGDAYMVCSGLPVRNGNKHVVEIALMSLQVLQAIAKFDLPQKPNEYLRVRIGLHSGPCVAGIVGLKMPRYCLFGDTVNTASRMESTSEPMKIQITDQTHALLEDNGTFLMEKRGPVEIKGKGTMITYWLIRGL